MSVIIRPEQFRTGITPLDPANQATMDLALRLALSVMLPPAPNTFRGADARDCELAVEAIRRVTSLYTDFVTTVLKNVSENVPVSDTVDLSEFLTCVQHAECDAIAFLELTADRASGR